jgi:hypothetical protein
MTKLAAVRRFLTTAMNNTFKDEITGLGFLIAANRQLSSAEAAEIVRQWTEQQKDYLFNSWQSTKKSADWKGDEHAKKDALFDEFYRLRKSKEILISAPEK